MATSEDLLAERRLRSTELALDAARRRLREAEAELAELDAHVVGLESEFERREEQRRADLRAMRDQLDAARAARRLSEQELQAERDRREALERELRGWRTPIDGVERELASAQRRARELEAELELVRRHAAEFEHSIQVAVAEERASTRELAARFAVALGELDALRETVLMPGGSGPRPAQRDDPERVAPERLDEALARLRAGRRTGADADHEDRDATGRPHWRWPWRH